VIGDMSPQQLLKLERNQQVLIQPGGNVETSSKLDYLQDEPYQGLYDPHPMFGGKREPRSKPHENALGLEDKLSRFQWELENNLIPTSSVSPQYLQQFEPGTAFDTFLANLMKYPKVYPFSSEEWAAQQLVEHFKNIYEPRTVVFGTKQTIGQNEYPCVALIIEKSGHRVSVSSHTIAHTLCLTMLRTLLGDKVKGYSSSQIEVSNEEAKTIDAAQSTVREIRLSQTQTDGEVKSSEGKAPELPSKPS
jgi:RNase H-fold protein (predicted Holliday junction resolvase)